MGIWAKKIFVEFDLVQIFCCSMNVNSSDITFSIFNIITHEFIWQTESENVCLPVRKPTGPSYFKFVLLTVLVNQIRPALSSPGLADVGFVIRLVQFVS